MGVKGFQGTSLLDYPGKIASLVFFGGCNLSCGFCHNPSLVLAPEELSDYPMAALLDELQERRRFIDGVVISGGEPTLDPELPGLLKEIKALGLLVKLDTNGLAPAVLENIMGLGLVDYLALDLKTAPERYGELHSGPVCVPSLRKSIRLILEGDIPYEFRTTCVPGLVEEEDIRLLCEQVRGAQSWMLQQFVPQHAMDEGVQTIVPHCPERLESFAALARNHVQNVGIRGL